MQQRGDVRMVGIIPEQHPERCRLFMQWKQMGWPILVDPLNLLGVSAVPITLAIDEYGIIRGKNLRVDAAAELDETFLSKSFDPPVGSASRESAEQPAQPAAPSLEDLKPGPSASIQAWRAYGDALVLWGGDDRLDEAIGAYQRVLKLDPSGGPTHFRLGVALRKRYDSARRQPNDFSAAVRQWRLALDIDPNQYIWRRRIQQYGPRLDKPYSFYDWVHQAREEILARGEEPAPLRVEPGGAEFAHPAETFTSETSERTEPDPRGRIHRDEAGFIRAETTIVPPVIRPGESARIHVVFRPNTAIKAHWNNEAGDLEYWLTPPEGWQAGQRSLTVANPPALVSLEARKIEFEVRCPENAQPGQVQLSSYALYYVCEDVNGTCLYRRQDIQIPIEVIAGSP